MREKCNKKGIECSMQHTPMKRTPWIVLTATLK